MFKRSSFLLKTLAIALTILGTMNFAVSAQEKKQSYAPSEAVDALHSAFGTHDARAVHAKGIILTGTFTPAASAATLTKAIHFQDNSCPVTVRFSDFTGIPNIPDTDALANPRGFAIKFFLPENATTDIVCHSFNGFPVATSDEFSELLFAIAASGPDAEKPTKLDMFLTDRPAAKTFLTTQKPAPLSYATVPYFGVNAFEFTNSDGETQFARYQLSLIHI